jgi:uncharacterized protein YceH (UPF0502 family)
MDIYITDVEARILGVLIEKKISTPEYYPLTLNSLKNGCNQKSNRDPVVNYTDEIVQHGVDLLVEKGLVSKSHIDRVVKFKENFVVDKNFIHQESAIICVLLLRGPQTPGEIKGRTERLYDFLTLEEVNETLSNLEEGKYVSRLKRQPGKKESRYCQCLTKIHEDSFDEVNYEPTFSKSSDREKIIQIEKEVEELRKELEYVKNEFQKFRSQF